MNCTGFENEFELAQAAIQFNHIDQCCFCFIARLVFIKAKSRESQHTFRMKMNTILAHFGLTSIYRHHLNDLNSQMAQNHVSVLNICCQNRDASISNIISSKRQSNTHLNRVTN